MHAAPSVNYPVGRSAFAGFACAVLVAGSIAGCAAWTVQAPWSWRQALGWIAAAVGAALASHGWRHSAAGLLCWDGLAWSWQEGGTSSAGRPVIALDLQTRLLLHWLPEAGRDRWLWLERASDASHWDALRRAVYSRASTPVPATGKPPAAEQ